jgi:IMP dehydrogenase/GMP reductase
MGEQRMKKLMMALLAGFVSVMVAGAYAGESKGDEMKSDTGKAKSEKGMAKKDAMTKDDTKKKGKDKSDEMKK